MIRCFYHKAETVSFLYLETALHVSGGTTTHHQERMQLYLQHLLFVTPLLLPAAIVEELELVNPTFTPNRLHPSWFLSLGGTLLVRQLVETLRYKMEGREFDSRWCHWIFSSAWSFRPHCGPGVDSASNRNEYQIYFLGVKGGRCVRLTTLPPSCQECQKNHGASNSWNPQGLSRPVMGDLYL
jgi:hypothetical protein